MDKQKHEPRYVTAVGLDDVQLGRGRPVVTSEGNQRFRALILHFKPEYISSNRHAHKDIVARKILAIISDRGGKFLRKIESSFERKKLAVEHGVDAWEVADEETSINKVKQALRENESSLPTTDDTLGGLSTARKSKKGPFIPDSIAQVEIGKRAADSDPGKSAAGSMKSTFPKKRRKGQVEVPLSLADSIRANASKLGSDFSFGESSNAPLNSNLTAAIPEHRSMKSEHDDRSMQEPVNASRFAPSANLHLLEHQLASATSIAGNYPVSYVALSENEQSADLKRFVSQNDKESFVQRTIASALAVCDGENESNQDCFAPSDSKREGEQNVHGGTPRTRSPSDEDKKPAAL